MPHESRPPRRDPWTPESEHGYTDAAIQGARLRSQEVLRQFADWLEQRGLGQGSITVRTPERRRHPARPRPSGHASRQGPQVAHLSPLGSHRERPAHLARRALCVRPRRAALLERSADTHQPIGRCPRDRTTSRAGGNQAPARHQGFATRPQAHDRHAPAIQRRRHHHHRRLAWTRRSLNHARLCRDHPPYEAGRRRRRLYAPQPRWRRLPDQRPPHLADQPRPLELCAASTSDTAKVTPCARQTVHNRALSITPLMESCT